MEMVLGMFFLILTNAVFQFNTEKLTRRTYIAAKALLITSLVELIDKMEFANVALDRNS